MVSASAPLPLSFGHSAPPLEVQVQLAPLSPAASGSATVAPSAATLPVLRTRIS